MLQLNGAFDAKSFLDDVPMSQVMANARESASVKK
jgi:hypothetical protein